MQKFKACLMTVLLTAACSLSINAQSPEENAETAATRREIGFGTNSILMLLSDGGTSSPYSFIYRWGNNDNLYRIGLSLNNSKSTYFQNDLLNANKRMHFYSDLSLGKEWRSEITNRWIINYGGDIVFQGHQNFNSHHRIYEPSGGTVREDIQGTVTTRIGGGLRPFISILFRIHDRLLLGTEAALTATVSRVKAIAESKVMINDMQSDDYPSYYRKEFSWEYNMRTLSTGNIFVYYRF